MGLLFKFFEAQVNAIQVIIEFIIIDVMFIWIFFIMLHPYFNIMYCSKLSSTVDINSLWNIEFKWLYNFELIWRNLVIK